MDDSHKNEVDPMFMYVTPTYNGLKAIQVAFTKCVVRECKYTLKYLQYQPIIFVEHRVLCGLTATLWLSVASGPVNGSENKKRTLF